MATVRFNRGYWVADYYDAKKRRRIERPKGHFENLTDQLRAAQALLADRVAEVADGLVHEGYGTFEDAAIRWLNSYGNRGRSRDATRVAGGRKPLPISMLMVARGGIEPPTRGFSAGTFSKVACSDPNSAK